MTQIYHIYSIYHVFEVYVPVQGGNTCEYTSTQVEILVSIEYSYTREYFAVNEYSFTNTRSSASIDSGALTSTRTCEYILVLYLTGEPSMLLTIGVRSKGLVTRGESVKTHIYYLDQEITIIIT